MLLWAQRCNNKQSGGQTGQAQPATYSAGRQCCGARGEEVGDKLISQGKAHLEGDLMKRRESRSFHARDKDTFTEEYCWYVIGKAR